MTAMRISLAGLLTASFGIAAAAFAQGEPEPLPERTQTDANGVDLFTGQVVLFATDVAIGQPGAGGLVYGRTYVENGWRGNTMGTVAKDGLKYSVSFGSGSDTFTETGVGTGVFTSDLGNGASLELVSGDYVYISSAGVKAIFESDLAGSIDDSMTPIGSVDCVAVLVQVISPAGDTTLYHYNEITNSVHTGNAARLQSVTNSFGYQLHFEYALNSVSSVSTQSAYDDWYELETVTGVNNAVEYCAPLAETCSFSNSWPHMDYAGPSAQLTSVTNADGKTTSYGYDGSDRLDEITLPSLRKVRYMRDGNGRVDEVDNGVGTPAWTYAYADASGERTTTVTDPTSKTAKAVFEISSGLLLEQIDGADKTTTFTYDSNDRLITATRPENNKVTLTYDNRGNVTQTTVTAKNGTDTITTSATYPGDTDTECTTAPYVRCNLPKKTTDALGNETDYEYDATHGGVTKITLPPPDAGQTRPETRITYAQKRARYLTATSTYSDGDQIWLPVEASACATGSSCDGTSDETLTTTVYGQSGQPNNLLPTEVTTEAGDASVSSTVKTTYTDNGDVATVDGPLAGTDDTATFVYDALRRRIRSIGPDPDGAGALKHRAVGVSFNADGQPAIAEQVAVTGASESAWTNRTLLQKAETVYDALGRPSQSIQFDGAGAAKLAIVQRSYDAAGRLECSALRMNPLEYGSLPSSACSLGTEAAFGPDRITKTTYDSAGRPSITKDAFGTSVEIDRATTTYTDNGLLKTIEDANGNLTTYEYDGFDRLVEIRYPSKTTPGTSSTTDYETFTYDDAGNVLTWRRRDGTTVATTYDDLHRPVVKDAAGTDADVDFAYDNFGRVTDLSRTGVDVSFAYDPLGRLVSETGALGTMSYAYDAAGRRTRATWPDSFYVDYDYDLAGAVTAVRENGATSGPGVLAAYAYDDLGRRVTLTRGNGVITDYAYDGAGRLADVSHDLAGTAYDHAEVFDYSPAGQLAEETAENDAYEWAGATNYEDTVTVNGLNQATSLDDGGGAVSLAHDDNGNMTDDGAKDYDYDADNRLTSAGAGAGLASLSYDAASRLHEVATSSTTARFLYSGAAMVGEYDGSNALQKRYVHGPGVDEPIVEYSGSGTSSKTWLVADARGSVVARTDGTGAATTVNTYDPYGLPASGNVGRFQYTGQIWLPEAGLHHYKARAYNPALGRFMQTDPIGYADGLNMYAYVGGDPVNSRDPSGATEEGTPQEDISDPDENKSPDPPGKGFSHGNFPSVYGYGGLGASSSSYSSGGSAYTQTTTCTTTNGPNSRCVTTAKKVSRPLQFYTAGFNFSGSVFGRSNPPQPYDGESADENPYGPQSPASRRLSTAEYLSLLTRKPQYDKNRRDIQEFYYDAYNRDALADFVGLTGSSTCWEDVCTGYTVEGFTVTLYDSSLSVPGLRIYVPDPHGRRSPVVYAVKYF